MLLRQLGTWDLHVQLDSASLPRSVPTVTHPLVKAFANSPSAQGVPQMQAQLGDPSEGCSLHLSYLLSRLEDKINTCLKGLERSPVPKGFYWVERKYSAVQNVSLLGWLYTNSIDWVA